LAIPAAPASADCPAELFGVEPPFPAALVIPPLVIPPLATLPPLPASLGPLPALTAPLAPPLGTVPGAVGADEQASPESESAKATVTNVRGWTIEAERRVMQWFVVHLETL